MLSSILLLLAAANIALAIPNPAPDPTPMPIIDKQGVDCVKIEGVLSALKKLGPPATAFCSSYLQVPEVETVTTTTIPVTQVPHSHDKHPLCTNIPQYKSDFQNDNNPHALDMSQTRSKTGKTP